MISTKLLAALAAVIVASGASVGAYVATQPAAEIEPVANEPVTAPSSSPNPQNISDSTIYAENSTIIAGEGSTIVNPNPTATPTIAPTPTPTPVQATIVYWHEASRTNTTVTLRLTANGVFNPHTLSVESGGTSGIQTRDGDLYTYLIWGEEYRLVCVSGGYTLIQD